jgi:hypothetical protein
LRQENGRKLEKVFPRIVTIAGRPYIFFGTILELPGHFITAFRIGLTIFQYDDKEQLLEMIGYANIPWNDDRTVEAWYLDYTLWKHCYKDILGNKRLQFKEVNSSVIRSLGRMGLLKNVIGDGNCGFRVLAMAIYNDQERWDQVRRDIFNTIPLLGFSERDATECETRLSHYTGGASREHWMDLELCIRLATMTYKCPIVSYVPSMYSEVLFPCSLPISENVDDPIGKISLQYLDVHTFVRSAITYFQLMV